ncbi:universal stress protein [Streptomyces ziwulingensis]|uniref:UspA domain-containing protein n=1 Tax=Streptomyces ziwulingensis TaxID=1045501 RepID=A0ABP9CQ09_9ACTN
MSRSHPGTAARVVVGVSGSLGSLTALARAADEARCRGAELWPVLAWQPPGGELTSRRSPGAPVLTEEWERLAGERLLKALDDVLGPYRREVPVRALVARGAPGPALVALAREEGDVLVVGTGRRSRLHRALWPSTSRYCVAHAVRPVLAVPPSPLQAEFEAAHRRNTWRLRLDAGCVAGEARNVPRDA